MLVQHVQPRKTTKSWLELRVLFLINIHPSRLLPSSPRVLKAKSFNLNESRMATVFDSEIWIFIGISGTQSGGDLSERHPILIVENTDRND